VFENMHQKRKRVREGGREGGESESRR